MKLNPNVVTLPQMEPMSEKIPYMAHINARGKLKVFNSRDANVRTRPNSFIELLCLALESTPEVNLSINDRAIGSKFKSIMDAALVAGSYIEACLNDPRVASCDSMRALMTDVQQCLSQLPFGSNALPLATKERLTLEVAISQREKALNAAKKSHEEDEACKRDVLAYYRANLETLGPLNNEAVGRAIVNAKLVPGITHRTIVSWISAYRKPGKPKAIKRK